MIPPIDDIPGLFLVLYACFIVGWAIGWYGWGYDRKNGWRD